MKRDHEAGTVPDQPDEPDDVEIIEVVGMDEDVSPRLETDEVEVTFDEEATTVAPRPPRRDPADVRSGPEEETQERLLRLRADFENLKKRLERERDDYHRHATASLVARLLPVLDNFERALASARQTRSGETLLEGVNLIQRQLLDELRREGLKPVEALGQPFDPSLHEAVATDASARLPHNTVVEELQRGYFFEDRLLRPALVRVSICDGGEHEGGAGFEES